MDDATLSRIKDKVYSLPFEPGVYLMKDAGGRVIYVGKAKQLKNRVSQYFQNSRSHTVKTLAMVAQVHDFDFFVTETEFEALVLECSLIKQYMPKYNILLKDSKGYRYIVLDRREPYPRLTHEPKKLNDGRQYYGPFASYGMTTHIIDTLQETLKLPDCERKFPRDIGKDRPCLNYHLGRCSAPCTGQITHEEYLELISQTEALLEGKFEYVTKSLTEEMENAAEKLDFERAAALRDRRDAVSRLKNRQNVIAGTDADTDAVGVFSGAKRAVAVLHYVDGNLLDKDVEVFDGSIEESDAELLEAFVTSYYSERPVLPKLILLSEDIESRESLETLFAQRTGKRTELRTPVRGEKKELVKLAVKNALQEAERLATRQDRQKRGLELLRKALGLENIPERIEAYDVSSLSGGDAVASMTVFEKGQSAKKHYRRFMIKLAEGGDDYGCMRESITRRILRFTGGDESFSPLPDIMLIDGGATHASAAREALLSQGTNIPVFGMVKDNRHRTRALVTPEGSEIAVAGDPQLFGFVGRIQEETHRFAIEYGRKLRKKKLEGSELDKIPGVGTARKSALFARFKSISSIKKASEAELAQAVPAKTAAAVYAYFHGDADRENSK